MAGVPKRRTSRDEESSATTARAARSYTTTFGAEGQPEHETRRAAAAAAAGWVARQQCGTGLVKSWWEEPTPTPLAHLNDAALALITFAHSGRWAAADALVDAGDGPVGLAAGDLIDSARRLLNEAVTGDE